MTPRGEAPKNPAGTNALGPVGIPPKAKATALPHKTPPQQGFFLLFFLFFSIYIFICSMSATLCEEGPSPREARQRLPKWARTNTRTTKPKARARANAFIK
jgi:hypothetical protein